MGLWNHNVLIDDSRKTSFIPEDRLILRLFDQIKDS
jgi:hypothetical protein